MDAQVASFALRQSRPFHRAKREDKLLAAIACTTAQGFQGK